MKVLTTENLKIAASAFGTIILIFCFMALLDRAGVDPIKWLTIAWWTAGIFGLEAYLHWEDIKRLRCGAILALALAIHLTLLVWFFPRRAWDASMFLLFFAPVEVAVIASMLYFLGGARHRFARHAARHYSPSTGRRSDSHSGPNG